MISFIHTLALYLCANTFALAQSISNLDSNTRNQVETSPLPNGISGDSNDCFTGSPPLLHRPGQRRCPISKNGKPEENKSSLQIDNTKNYEANSAPQIQNNVVNKSNELLNGETPAVNISGDDGLKVNPYGNNGASGSEKNNENIPEVITDNPNYHNSVENTQTYQEKMGQKVKDYMRGIKPKNDKNGDSYVQFNQQNLEKMGFSRDHSNKIKNQLDNYYSNFGFKLKS